MPQWVDAGPLADIEKKHRKLFKAGRKQVLVIAHEGQVFAINNRCPHEGYPLSEGTLGAGCTLTCNWHNWKFNLESGETLVGGDRLRRYSIDVREGHVFVDVADAPAAERQLLALENLGEAVVDNDYDRMAREVARFIKAGGDELEPLRRTIASCADLLEFGMTHAFAAAADWVDLHAQGRTDGEKLVALVEPIAHIAWDTLREDKYPYCEVVEPWDFARFVNAIKQENEREALAQLNGALAMHNFPLNELRHALATSALAHYQDFGHSVIYTVKSFELIEKLGPGVAAPVLRSLVRSIIYASREDKIPEFRHYAVALKNWGTKPLVKFQANDLVGQSVAATLDRIVALEGSSEDKYRLLLESSATAMLRFDMSVDLQADKPVSHNVRWLDYTHMLTFGNGVRRLCSAHPELWPQALLQMGCFLGRNSPFLLSTSDRSFDVADRNGFLERESRALYDHGIREPIYACHRVKVLAAVRAETGWAGDSALTRSVLAATNRYLNNSIKYHHALRFAQQSLSFVDAEG
ncbi:MAG: Rieske (2Fe-2S) protein [Micropepsaceae bacterium]